MKKLLVAIVAAGSGLLLTSSAWSRQYEQPLVVSVSRAGEACQTIVAGERIAGDRLVEIVRSARNRRAVVIHDGETPFKCIGVAITALQRAGLTRIDAVMWDATGVRQSAIAARSLLASASAV